MTARINTEKKELWTRSSTSDLVLHVVRDDNANKQCQADHATDEDEQVDENCMRLQQRQQWLMRDWN